MFCKYCGKQIDSGTMRCRACGRPVGQLAGGNGFWDLSDGASPETAPTADDRAVQELRGQVEALQEKMESRPAGKKSAAPLVATLLAAVGLGLGVYAYLQVRDLEAKLDEQRLAYEQRLTQLAEELTREEQPQIEAEPLEIAKHPEDEEIILAQAEEKCIFTARVYGGIGPYTARWEKQDETTGEFYPIVDGEEGYRTEESQGSYQLWLTDARQKHLGSYRFVVTDHRGEVVASRTVVLREKGTLSQEAGTATGIVTQEPEDGND